MTTRKTTKRALLLSCLSMLLCLSMLVGSTFAWFTDTATTGVNTIVAGSLKIDLGTLDGTTFTSVKGQTIDFVKAAGHESESVLWEPGCTYELPDLYIKNMGNLAFKYQVVISGIQGNAKLNEAIEWTVDYGYGTGNTEGHMLGTGDYSEPIKISGHMKETAGNEYQGLSISGISITVFATQDTKENDSFNDQYDANAPTKLADLAGEAAKKLSGKVEVAPLNVTLTDVDGSENLVIGDANLKASGVTELVFNGGVINTPYNGNVAGTNIDYHGNADHDGGTAHVYNEENGSKIMLNVPEGTKVVFKNLTVNGYYNFYARFTSANVSIEFENCVFNGGWVGQTGGFSNITFKNCTFTLNGVDTVNVKNTNPVWLQANNGQTLTFDGCTIEGNRPIKYDMGTTTAKLNVTNCTFKLAAAEYDINANRPDRVTAVRFDTNNTANINIKNNTMVSGYAFYQTNLFGTDYDNIVDAAANNNTKPATAKWCIEY